MYLTLPSVELWFNDTGGDGVPVVFLHPQAGSADSFEYQVGPFERAGYRCITYDRRGWARSKPNPDASQPGFSSDDLAALVAHLSLPKFHLVGSASGGIVGLDYACRFASMLRSLVLDNSYGGLQDEHVRQMLRRLYPEEMQKLPWYLLGLSPSYRAINPLGTSKWREVSDARSSEHHPRQPPATILTLETIAQLRLPLLAIAGEASLVSPPAIVREVASAVPGSYVITIPEGGQASHWEQPELWNKHVLEFIALH